MHFWKTALFFFFFYGENYMECAFDIIGVRYNEVGVSTGKKHPLLLKDVCGNSAVKRGTERCK